MNTDRTKEFADSMEFVVTSNGPGEISTWVKPVVRELKRVFPKGRITVFLLPCQYASGHEEELVRSLKVDRVYTPNQYWEFVFKGTLPANDTFSSQGRIIFLGGDQFHPVLLSWRLKYPVYGYTENAVRWPQFYQKYFLRDEQVYQRNLKKIPAKKMEVSGDLMLDAIYQDLEPMGLTSKEEIIEHYCRKFKEQKEAGRFLVTVMPGSRDWQAKYLIPLFLRAAEEMKKLQPELEFQLLLSPLLDVKTVEEWVQDERLVAAFNGIPSQMIQEGTWSYLQTSDGLRVRLIRENKVASLLESVLALTIPGTNTAELAILGIPFLCVFPLTKPEVIPLDGLAGMVDKLPGLGPLLKKELVNYIASKRTYYAWPNLKAQKMIARELVGETPWDKIRDSALELLRDEKSLMVMSEQLIHAMGEHGAARRLVAVLNEEMVKS